MANEAILHLAFFFLNIFLMLSVSLMYVRHMIIYDIPPFICPCISHCMLINNFLCWGFSFCLLVVSFIIFIFLSQLQNNLSPSLLISKRQVCKNLLSLSFLSFLSYMKLKSSSGLGSVGTYNVSATVPNIAENKMTHSIMLTKPLLTQSRTKTF